MVYADGVNLSSSKSRKSFIRELRRQHKDAAADDVELENALLELLELAESALGGEEMPDAPAELDDEIRVEDYSQAGGRYVFVQMRNSGDGPVETRAPLSNFVVTITDEVVVDDGADVRRYLRLEGRLADGRLLPPLESWHPSSLAWAGYSTATAPRPAYFPARLPGIVFEMRFKRSRTALRNYASTVIPAGDE
jgi:hypothetical protein